MFDQSDVIETHNLHASSGIFQIHAENGISHPQFPVPPVYCHLEIAAGPDFELVVPSIENLSNTRVMETKYYNWDFGSYEAGHPETQPTMIGPNDNFVNRVEHGFSDGALFPEKIEDLKMLLQRPIPFLSNRPEVLIEGPFTNAGMNIYPNQNNMTWYGPGITEGLVQMYNPPCYFTHISSIFHYYRGGYRYHLKDMRPTATNGVKPFATLKKTYLTTQELYCYLLTTKDPNKPTTYDFVLNCDTGIRTVNEDGWLEATMDWECELLYYTVPSPYSGDWNPPHLRGYLHRLTTPTVDLSGGPNDTALYQQWVAPGDDTQFGFLVPPTGHIRILPAPFNGKPLVPFVNFGHNKYKPKTRYGDDEIKIVESKSAAQKKATVVPSTPLPPIRTILPARVGARRPFEV